MLENLWNRLQSKISRRELNIGLATFFSGLTIGSAVGGFAGYERAIRIFGYYTNKSSFPSLADPNPNTYGIAPIDDTDKKEGDPAPDFELLDFEGRQHRLRDHKGTPVIISFLSYFGKPSQLQMPSLDRIAAEYSGEIKVFAITDDRYIPNKHLEKNKFNSVVTLLDNNGKTQNSYRSFSSFDLPITYFVDREGIIAFVQEGPTDLRDPKSTARQKLEELVKNNDDAASKNAH